MKRTLKYVLYKDGKFYVSQCLNVELSSFGDTPKEAVDNLNEALTHFFEDEEAVSSIIRIEETQIGETTISI